MKIIAIIHWIVRITTGALVCIAGMLLSAYLLLQTRSGMNWLSGEIKQRTSGIVELRNLSWRFPAHIRADEMILHDHESTNWLHAADLNVNIDWRALVQKTIAIEQLRAEQVVWHRMPAFQRSTASRPPRDPDAPLIFDHVHLQKLAIHDATISASIIGYVFRGSIDGDALWDISTHRITAEASSALSIHGRWPALLRAQFIYDDLTYELPLIDLQVNDPKYKLHAQGDLRIQPSRPDEFLTATVSNMHAEAGTFAATIGTPATYHLSNRISRISAPQLLMNGSATSVEIVMSGKQLDAVNVQSEPIDVSRLPIEISSNWPALHGYLDVDVDFSDLTTQPRGTARAALHTGNMGIPLFSRHPNIDVIATAGIAATGMFAQAATSNDWMDVSVTSFGAWSHQEGFIPIKLSRDQGIQNRIQFNADLANIAAGIRHPSFTLGGKIRGDISSLHRSENPSLTGWLELIDGEFRYPSTGTFLDQINIQIDGQKNVLAIREARARDGSKGTISGRGTISLNDAWHPSWTLALDLTKASLFRVIRTELPLSGSITFAGDLDQSGIAGDLWLEPFRFVIPRRLPPSIRRLDVVEMNHPDPSRNTTSAPEKILPERQPAARRPIDFNIGIRMRANERFEVAGRGLKSEWGQGEFRLGGNTQTPTLTGSMRMVQGYAMLLGRRFTFEEGRLMFSGPVPPQPQLNVTASTRVGDVVARLAVSGNTTRPAIKLSSDPLLNQDEIMSMILFGKPSENMTPFQAIALANGLRLLSGSDDDLVAFIDAGQNLLRVDQFDVKQDEAGDGLASVSVGKYFGSMMYVEGEKGFGGAEDVVKVTLELPRRFVLETETSPRIREGIHLNWRYDY